MNIHQHIPPFTNDEPTWLLNNPFMERKLVKDQYVKGNYPEENMIYYSRLFWDGYSIVYSIAVPNYVKYYSTKRRRVKTDKDDWE